MNVGIPSLKNYQDLRYTYAPPNLKRLRRHLNSHTCNEPKVAINFENRGFKPRVCSGSITDPELANLVFSNASNLTFIVTSGYYAIQKIAKIANANLYCQGANKKFVKCGAKLDTSKVKTAKNKASKQIIRFIDCRCGHRNVLPF